MAELGALIIMLAFGVCIVWIFGPVLGLVIDLLLALILVSLAVGR
jgi:hypothetical protein